MERFKDRLWRRMQELDLNYEELARRIGVSGVYVSKIMQGAVPSDEVILKLSRALSLDLADLIMSAHYEKAPDEVKSIFASVSLPEGLPPDARPDNIESASLGSGKRIPVVGMVQAGEFTPAEDGEYPPGVADSYVYTDRKGKNLYGARITNDSMEPEFHEGDVLVINPNLDARSGDYVIAKLLDDNEATFKKLIIHENLIILRPLNPRYQDMVITEPEKVSVMGKVVERKTLF